MRFLLDETKASISRIFLTMLSLSISLFLICRSNSIAHTKKLPGSKFKNSTNFSYLFLVWPFIVENNSTGHEIIPVLLFLFV